MNGRPRARPGGESFIRRHYWRLILGLLALAVIAAGSWAYYTSRYPSWYEEVRLSDGRVITIHQKHEYYENYGTNQSWVEIDLPELGGKRIWHSYLKPMRVDSFQGVVYVYGRPRGPRQLEYYRYPKNQMVAFKWNGTGFMRIPFMDVPETLRKEENIYSCVPRQLPNILTLQIKDKKWCEPSGERLQFTRQINIFEYRKFADEMAGLANWTDRSE